MIRKATDRRVRIVMSAIERALASPDRACVVSVAGIIVANQADLFDVPTWRPESIPPVVLAMATGAPSSVLDAYVAEARRQLKWIAWWDREGYAESQRVPSPEEIAEASVVN